MHGVDHFPAEGGCVGNDGMQRQEARVRDVEDFRPRVERRGDDDRGRRPRSPPPGIVAVVVAAVAETDDPTYAVVPKVRVDVSPVALDPFHGSVPVIVACSSVVIAVGIAAAVGHVIELVVPHSPLINSRERFKSIVKCRVLYSLDRVLK